LAATPPPTTGFLEARGHIGPPHRTALRGQPTQYRRLQPAEGEVQGVAAERTRERDRCRVPVDRAGVDCRAPGEGQVEQAGDLVEGLARRVVQGLTQGADAVGPHRDQRGVSTRYQQADHRLRQRSVLQLIDDDVRGQMVHPVDRAIQRRTQGLRRRDTDEERAHESGTRGHGDRIDIAESDTCVRARAFDRGHHRLEMSTTSDLRHDTTEAGLLIHTRRQSIRAQLIANDDADPRLVAGGLDPQDHGTGHSALRRISASEPSG
jgi:hypothetical protein